MNKRGASVVIGWVLLVGLSVTLAIMTTAWMREQAEKTSETIVKDVEGDILCSEVSLKGFIEIPPCLNIDVTNTGYHKIAQISLRHKFGIQDIEVNLLPQQSKVLNIVIPSKVDVVPIIQSGNDLIGCANRKLVFTC